MNFPALANGWTSRQYAGLRVAFGLWLALHFLRLLPWSAELFSNAGVLADASASPYLRLFPNLFAISDAPAFVRAMHLAAVAAGLLLALGRFDRTAAIFLWYVLACQFGRNPLTLNPSLPFLGLLLWMHALLPRARGNPAWRFDSRCFALLWILMAVGYSYSGWTKLISPSWADGSALARVLHNPLARESDLRAGLLAAPEWMLHGVTWGALALELAFAPLACFRLLRPWVWLAMVLMHLSLFVLVDFADLTAGMLFLHAYTFDPAWLKFRGASSSSNPGKPAVW